MNSDIIITFLLYYPAFSAPDIADHHVERPCFRVLLCQPYHVVTAYDIDVGVGAQRCYPLRPGPNHLADPKILQMVPFSVFPAPSILGHALRRYDEHLGDRELFHDQTADRRQRYDGLPEAHVQEQPDSRQPHDHVKLYYPAFSAPDIARYLVVCILSHTIYRKQQP